MFVCVYNIRREVALTAWLNGLAKEGDAFFSFFLCLLIFEFCETPAKLPL